MLPKWFLSHRHRLFALSSRRLASLEKLMSRLLGRAHIRTPRGARPGGSDPVPKESESGSAQHRSTQYARTGGAPPARHSTAMESLRTSLVDPDFSAVGAHRQTRDAGHRQRTRSTEPVLRSNATQPGVHVTAYFKLLSICHHSIIIINLEITL
jgi:hypothetical protein